MTLHVYGIPNCGTCKKAMTWLEQTGIPYVFINTRDHPPTPDQIQSWAATLGTRAMRNTSGQSYRALGERRESMTEAEWIEAFAQDPMLIKRPLFVKDDVAVLVGFRHSPAVLQERLS